MGAVLPPKINKEINDVLYATKHNLQERNNKTRNTNQV